MSLYRIEHADGLVAPTFVVAFDGWVDAGSAASLAAGRLVTDGDVVARFDVDVLLDYRSRRPALQIVDGRPTELAWPELTVRRGRHGDRDLLVLAGPEPDHRWQELAGSMVELAQRLEVAEWIGLGAIPAAVPHTRPVHVMGTASRPDLLRAGVEAGPEGVLRVPAAALSVLDKAAADAGLPTVGYFAQVPHYVTGPYPAGAIALLRVLGRHLGTQLPLGDLEEEARQLQARLDAATALDESTREHVARLESMADQARLPAGDELIAEIEQFLRDRGGSGGSTS